MKIAIIIVLFNGDDYIQRCLEPFLGENKFHVFLGDNNPGGTEIHRYQN